MKLQTRVTTGLTLPFTSIWLAVFKVLISLKQSWNSEKNFSLFISIPQLLFISCKCSLVSRNVRLFPGIGTESTSINQILKEFLWSRALANYQNLWAIICGQFNIYLLKIRFGRYFSWTFDIANITMSTSIYFIGYWSTIRR